MWVYLFNHLSSPLFTTNEGLSITENLAQIGVKIPSTITDRLQTIENEKEQSKDNADKAAG